MSVPRHGTQEHDALKRVVTQRLDQSERLLQSRHKRWRETEHAYRLFVDPDQLQEPIEPISEQAQLLYPYPTSVVIPMSYAIAQTLISFFISLFTNQVPYLRVGNRNPESAGAAKAQELMLSYQLDYWGWTELLFQWLLDSLRYGMGVVKTGWRIDQREQVIRESIPLTVFNQTFQVPFETKRSVTEYEGNYSEVIDPFTWRPDLRHPVGQFRDGSFCGSALYRSYFELLRKQQDGLYEQVDTIPERTIDGMGQHGRSGSLAASDRDRIMQANTFFGEQQDRTDAGMVLVEEVILDLIPRDVGIGEGTRIERWLVTIANRSVIIRAESYPYAHQDYFFSVMESAPDRHAMLNPGVLELMNPISQHVSWLYNAHVENIRKALNDMFVVDPDRIDVDDILNPSAGKIIRLRPSYYGTGVEGAIKQLDVGDVTKGNIETAGVLIELLQRLSAATDQIQGEQEQTKRTATEISMATNMASGRLRVQAKLLAGQGIQPLARQMVQNNMSFLSQAQYLRLAGSLEQEYQAVASGKFVEGGIQIAPEDIQGLFDFPVFDASMPLDPVRYAETWMQVMQMALSNQAVAPYLDHLSLFKQVIHTMGIRDISRFILPPQTQVMPDQQVQEQEQAGNLIPMPGQAPVQGNGALQ